MRIHRRKRGGIERKGKEIESREKEDSSPVLEPPSKFLPPSLDFCVPDSNVSCRPRTPVKTCCDWKDGWWWVCGVTSVGVETGDPKGRKCGPEEWERGRREGQESVKSQLNVNNQWM